MIEIFKNKVQFIDEISEMLVRGIYDEKEHYRIIDKVIKVMVALEVAEGKVAELESYRDKYYEIKTDSRYLKILLDIVNESTDKENILAKYQHRDSYILDDEIPF